MIVDDLFENVAGPEKCWPGYRKVGTKPGTGRNAGKRVNDCEKINESAGELRIGDPVIITGDVQFRGKTGDVREIGRDGSFVVVNLYNYGPRSFHVSDVSYNDYADEEDAEEDVAEAEKNPHTSALGKALYRDLSKEKKASPQQVQRNKERWAQRQAEREQGVAEGLAGEELANEVYTEFERMYPNLARRANERMVHAAVMDVLNYGGDSNPSALAQDVARAVKRNMQGVAEADTSADRQRALLDRLAARVGLPAGSSMDEIEAAQQAQLNRPQSTVARPQPTDDPDFAAGLAAAQSGQGPLAIMLAQPTIANDQRLLDTIASSYGLPAGLSAQEIQAQSRGALTQTAVSSIARALDLPTGMNRNQLLAAFKKKQQQGVAEGYGDDRGDYNATAQAANLASRKAKDPVSHRKAADLHNRAATYALSAGRDSSVVRDHQMAAWEHSQAAKGIKEQGVAEADAEKIGGRYDPEEFDQMVLRLKTLAGAGPLKTVWDPQKRVYRNVPINPPQDKK
jgi:hypothetical protein